MRVLHIKGIKLVNIKEINPEFSMEGLMMKLKLQNFGHLLQKVDSVEKTDAGQDWGQEEMGKPRMR